MAVNVFTEIVVEDKHLKRGFGKLEMALSSEGLAAFLGETIDPYIRQRATGRFQSEGDDVTGKWIPLASATQQIRANLGYGPAHPINKRTGELERYITQSPHDLQILPIGASLIMPGTSPGNEELKSKVKVAQKGDPKFGQSGTPARPVMGMNSRDLIFVVSALSIYLDKAVN